MISIVDYGVGNVQAFLNLFSRLGIEARRADTSSILKESSHLVLPGVGHFDHAMNKLNNSGLREPLENLVIGSKIPLLGICVGMQMLANESEEGLLPGLGWISAEVRAFSNNKNSSQLPLPHMGWNNINIKKSILLSEKKINSLTEFYFLHSYYFDAFDKSIVTATSNYGLNFDSMVSYENIHGVQFHPEKSHKWGEELLKSFSKL
ncbi:imidazole glycerol phosphate synthase subunit HisH [Candidatus Pelagibacter sp.]|nr:imidazole glycerol phosphate synthase subunit HisH [Candidatus Pelagibacter sp.]